MLRICVAECSGIGEATRYLPPDSAIGRLPRGAMKIVLDLTRLVREGKLSTEQAAELQALASRDTGSLAIKLASAVVVEIRR